MTQEDELTGLTEAAKKAGVRVDPSTLRRAAQSGDLEAKKIGRDWLTTARAVKKWYRAEEHHKTAPRKYRPKD